MPAEAGHLLRLDTTHLLPAEAGHERGEVLGDLGEHRKGVGGGEDSLGGLQAKIRQIPDLQEVQVGRAAGAHTKQG